MSLQCDGTAKYVEASTAAVTAPPFDMVCRAKASQTTAFAGLLTLTAVDSTVDLWQIYGAATGGLATFRARDASDAAATSGTGAWSTSAWKSAIASEISNVSRYLSLSGVRGSQNATDRTPDLVALVRIGATAGTGPVTSTNWQGKVCDAGIFTGNLDPAQRALYYFGYRADEIPLTGSQALSVYQPLFTGLDDTGYVVSFTSVGAVFDTADNPFPSGPPVVSGLYGRSKPTAGEPCCLRWAGVPGVRLAVDSLAWSYAATPVGNLQIRSPLDTILFELDIATAGARTERFKNAIRGAEGEDLVVVMTSGTPTGGTAIQGILDVELRR